MEKNPLASADVCSVPGSGRDCVIYATTEHRGKLPVLYNRLPLAICFTHGSVYTSVPVSKIMPPLFLPHPVSMCLFLCLCLYSCLANRFICTFFFFDSTYIHYYIIFVFLFLSYFILYDRL